MAVASPAAGRPNSAPKPTVVLVHGGWDNSTGWNAVVSKLQREGCPVIAPANPLRGLTSDADYVSSVLDTIEGRRCPTLANGSAETVGRLRRSAGTEVVGRPDRG